MRACALLQELAESCRARQRTNSVRLIRGRCGRRARRPNAALTGVCADSVGTPNGHKITVALEEMGLAYEGHIVNIMKGEQHSPEFRAKVRRELCRPRVSRRKFTEFSRPSAPTARFRRWSTTRVRVPRSETAVCAPARSRARRAQARSRSPCGRAARF